MFRAIEESNLSDITKKNYMHTIEKLEVALNAHLIDILQNPEKYIQEIDRLYPKESSLRTLYATIMSVFKYDRDLKKILMEEYDIWMDRFNELNNKYKTNLKMNMPTAEQREKDIGYSDFKSKMDEMPHGSDELQLQQLQAQQLAAEEAAAPPPFLPRTPGASLGGAPEYKKGGLVKKTTFAKVHKGEVVIPKSRVNTIEKAVKKAGLKSILKPVKGKE